MASDAEIDLLVNAAGALGDVQRDLQRIVRRAEDTAPDVTLNALVNQRQSLQTIRSDIDDLVTRAQNGADDIDLDAALNQQRSLNQLDDDLANVIRRAQANADDIDLQATLNTARSLRTVQDGLNDIRRRAAADPIPVRVRVDDDDANRRLSDTDGTLGRLIRTASSALGPLGSLAGGLGKVGGGAGAAVPALVSVVGAIESIVPAAAVATQGMLALQLVTGTLKLGFSGVEDAIKNAFDPDVKPEDLAASLEKLAPSAREFVLELRSMRGVFDELRLSVQQELFAGLADGIDELGKTVLPDAQNALRGTAVVLNEMATGVINAASELGSSGVLRQALTGTVAGLDNLQRVPAQVTNAFGRLAAASAPAFERITQAAANSFDRITVRLNEAFATGELEGSIDDAIEVIAQFGRAVGNIFEGIGNIIGEFQDSGEGLFAVFEKITQAFADVTASESFQQALGGLVDVVLALVDTALPLLKQALEFLGPIFEELAPPIDMLIRVLGDALGPVIDALGPVLVGLAGAIGDLIPVLFPVIELAGELLAAILPALNPLLAALGEIFREATPIVAQLAGILADTLVPIFTAFATEVLPVLLPPLIQLAETIFPLLGDILTDIAPLFEDLSKLFVDVITALAPISGIVLELVAAFLEKLMPVIKPLLGFIIELITQGFEALEWVIRNIVIPAINFISDLLNGDFSAAWESIKTVVANVAAAVWQAIKDMAIEVGIWLLNLIGKARDFVARLAIDFVLGVKQKVDQVIAFFRELPSTILSFLRGLPGQLLSIGTDIINGLISGLRNGLARVKEIAADIGNAVSGGVKSILGIRSPSRVMMGVGADIVRGLNIGMRDLLPELQSTVGGIALAIPSTARDRGLSGFGSMTGMDGRPVVQVYLGNELLNRHIDNRVHNAQNARVRTFAQGVRR